MFKTPPSNTVQNLLRWVIMGFFAYALLHSYTNPSPQPKPPQPRQSANNTKGSDCNKNDFPLFSIPLMPAYTLSVKTEDLKLGVGGAAVCGQKARLHYEYVSQSSKLLEKGEKTIVIGGGEAPHGVELGIIGMKPGGERKVLIPPPLVFTTHANAELSPALKDKLASAKISLLDISPAQPQSSFPLRAIDTMFGNGRQVACGDKVSASISLWKSDGTELYSSASHPVTFTLGQSRLPYGIELGMGQMMEEGERIVIIPPAYLKPLVDDASGSGALPVVLPENETLVARIGLVHIGDYPAATPHTPQSASPKR